jgi:hypothetical protein
MPALYRRMRRMISKARGVWAGGSTVNSMELHTSLFEHLVYVNCMVTVILLPDCFYAFVDTVINTTGIDDTAKSTTSDSTDVQNKVFVDNHSNLETFGVHTTK